MLQIRLFGAFEVEGVDELALGSRKARTLLKILALARGAVVSVDTLIDALWPDRAPERPADQVSVLVSRLRHALGAARLPRVDNGYALKADWIDVAEFDARALEAANRQQSAAYASAAAQAALRLVRGPLLAGDDGLWVEAERRHLEARIAQLRLMLAEAMLSTGQPLDAALHASEALRHDPYDERTLRLIMRAHVDAGRPASALAVYASVRERLAEDLGVSPTVETEDLHTKILRAEPANRSPVESGQAALVGRGSELAALDAAFTSADARSHVVVIEGDAGIGKSALLRAWLERRVDETVLLGRCDELGIDLSLQPILDAVADRLRALPHDEAIARLGSARTLVGPLIGIDVFLGDAPPSPTTTTDGETAKTALYTALVEVIERLAGGREVVLAIEDLHLAGPSTLAWLRFALRRSRKLRAIATRRPGRKLAALDEIALPLGPLDRAGAIELVGDERASALYDRSGGSPLFLLQLAAHDANEVPRSIVESVRARLSMLGEAAGTLRAAAIIGDAGDVDLIAAVAGVPVAAVLDHLEAGVQAHVLQEAGTHLSFAHDLVREAITADVSAARRAFMHREAANVLQRRPGADPAMIAFHARLGGDVALAAHALRDAAALAMSRYDDAQAESMLDEAIALAPTADLYTARARVRMARSAHALAAQDAQRAIELDPHASVFELAGWIAYYRRDYDKARGLADEAVRRATDATLRESAEALGGRIRHSRGELAQSEQLLTRAARSASNQVRALASVWLGGLLIHLGDAERALEVTSGAIPDHDHLGHPFAPMHLLFARAFAYAMRGEVDRFAGTVDDLRRAMERAGEEGRRFQSVVANFDSWLFRTMGQFDLAREANERAAGLVIGTMSEPAGHALLDLAEISLRLGDIDDATLKLNHMSASLTNDGTMAWHQRERLGLLASRAAFASGELDRAAELADSVAADAAQRGARRHLAFARAQSAIVRAAQREPLDATIDATVAHLRRCAAMEAWWVAADLARTTGNERWWHEADECAAALERAARACHSVDIDALRRHLSRELQRGR